MPTKSANSSERAARSEGGWTWEPTSTAQDDLSKRSLSERERLLNKLDEIVESTWRDPSDYSKPLQARTGYVVNHNIPTRSGILAIQRGEDANSTSMSWGLLTVT